MNRTTGKDGEMSPTNNIKRLSLLDGRLRYEPDPANQEKTVSAGDYVNGKPHFRYPMKDGQFHGECLCWHRDGSIASRELFINGKLSDMSRKWHENGIKSSEGFWADGLREKKHRQWYDNGNIHVEENFIKGLPHGKRLEWYSTGAIKAETNYQKGLKHGPDKTWYENGTLKKQVDFSTGRQAGLEAHWYPDGTLKSSAPYLGGRINGTKSIWHENGKLMLQCPYVWGQKHGRERKWDPEGKLLSYQIYVQGAPLDNDTNDLIKSGRLTAQHILKMRNAAVRRICLEEFGYARFLSQLSPTVIDKQGEQELVRLDWHRDEEPIYLVKVKCPTTGAFYTLRVPTEVKSVKEAVAWTFNVPEKEYQPQAES